MATISFWARQDSTTASNASLNPEGDPAELITFTDNNGSGDLSIEYNGGLPDPDTQVIIGGTAYPFTVQLVGVLPDTNPGANQVPDILEGQQVAVISVNVGGDIREYFFIINNTTGAPVDEALMNQFGTGAIALDSVNLSPPPFTCFCRGTMIATPSGARKIETLTTGDFVLTDAGEARQVVWLGSSRVPSSALRQNPNIRPVVIPANAFGPGLPKLDLHVSPQHRIVLQDPACELLFGDPAVLVPAKYLVGTFAEVAQPTAEVEYFHILLEEHEMLVSNGLATESFQPARRMIDVMDPASRARLEAQMEALGAENLLTRKDRHRSLRHHEAQVLVKMLDRHTAPPVQKDVQRLNA